MITANQLQTDIKKGLHALTTTSNPCTICNEAKDLGQRPNLHFHGSDFGKCVRKIQYERSTIDKPISEDLAAFFLDGHLHEKTILEALKYAGYKVEQGREVELKTTEGIHIIGHIDGVISKYKEEYILECKAVKNYSFVNYFEQGALPKEYIMQVQCYMHLTGIHKAFVPAGKSALYWSINGKIISKKNLLNERFLVIIYEKEMLPF